MNLSVYKIIIKERGHVITTIITTTTTEKKNINYSSI